YQQARQQVPAKNDRPWCTILRHASRSKQGPIGTMARWAREQDAQEQGHGCFGSEDCPDRLGNPDQARCNLRAAHPSVRLSEAATNCEVRESDDETVDQRIVSPVKKAGTKPEAFIWERGARISSRPGRNSGPLARGRIHLCRLAPSTPIDPCMARAGHTSF